MLIRLGAAATVLAVIFDYYKRKQIARFVEALRASDAYGVENAADTATLTAGVKHADFFVKILLGKPHLPLRRYIACTSTVTAEEYADKKRKMRSERLTGSEKWYLPESERPAPVVFGEAAEAVEDERAEKEEAAPKRSLPASLRDGGESSPASLVFGIAGLIVFAELIIRYLPEITKFFTGISNFGA